MDRHAYWSNTYHRYTLKNHLAHNISILELEIIGLDQGFFKERLIKSIRI